MNSSVKTDSAVLAEIQKKFPGDILSMHSQHGDDTAIVKRENVFSILKFLRDDPGLAFNFMMDITAVDYPEKDPRFEVVYHLYSLSKNRRLRIKAPVPLKDPVIASCVSLWIGANWFERECFDLYGIRFDGHPDLRRILMYEGFEGHPLRKDFPVKNRQPLVDMLEPQL